MSHVLVIAGRELAEKRFVFVAALAFAILAALVPLMPGLHGSGAEAVVITAMILAAGFTLGLSAILGATIVGRDIAAGRMSFYFARPLGGASIWFGKLAAAASLVVLSFFITIAPALVAGPLTIRRIWSGSLWQMATIIGITALVLFFGGHAIGTMIRSRSAILLIDFVAAVLVVAIAWLLIAPLVGGQAVTAVIFLGKSFAVALLVAAIAAGAWQLIDGRSDRGRSHRAFSTFFWSAVGAALLAAAIVVAWIASAGPVDLSGRIAALQPRQGDWAILTGNARHRFDYHPTFLYNAATGASTRANAVVLGRFSADGQRAVFFETPSPFSPSTELVVRTAAQGWRRTPTQLVFGRWVGPIAASDDVARVAVTERNNFTIYDIASRRALGSARLPEHALHMMFFVSPDLLRIYSIAGANVQALEYGVAARTLRTVGDVTLGSRPVLLRVTADGARALLVERGALLILRDARTLQPIGTVEGNGMSARFLADGRLLTADRALHVGGKTIDVGAATSVHIIGEVASGKVLVAAPQQGAWSMLLVDVDAGVVVRRAGGLQPVTSLGTLWSPDPRPAMLNPNGLYTKPDGSLVRWNPLRVSS